MPSTFQKNQKCSAIVINGGKYLLRPCADEQGHHAAGLYCCTANRATLVSEPVFVAPVTEGNPKGCLIRWGDGGSEAFLSFEKLLRRGAQKDIAIMLLNHGLRFDVRHVGKLLGYITSVFASGVETTPNGSIPAGNLSAPLWAEREVL